MLLSKSATFSSFHLIMKSKKEIYEIKVSILAMHLTLMLSLKEIRHILKFQLSNSALHQKGTHLTDTTLRKLVSVLTGGWQGKVSFKHTEASRPVLRIS